MVRKLVVGMLCSIAIVTAIGREAQAADPLTKCQAAKLRAAGKKLAAKLACYAKAKTKPPFTVNPACLAKAEASFAAAMAKAGVCMGTASALEAQIDECVDNLAADAPANTKCDASSVRAMGKGEVAELRCVARNLSKPGTAPACISKAVAKTGAALTKAGGCAAGDTQSDIDDCLTHIEAVLLFCPFSRQPPPCCGAERTILTGSGGMLAIGGLTPFPFPTSVTTTLDSGVADATCKHDVVIPPGGFSMPIFCIPALQFSSEITASGCETGTGEGAGRLWDGNYVFNGGAADANVTQFGDSSDGVCDPGPPPCGSLDQNALGDIDTTYTQLVPAPACAPPNRAVRFDLPLHVRTWMDSVTCPGANYNPADGDVLVSEFDFIVTPTTGKATGQFVDKNGDACTLPAGSTGFGAQCAAGPSGPCSVDGVNAVGPCCVNGDTMTLAAAGVAFTNGAPLYDLGFTAVLPNTVSCGSPSTDTCVVTTDPCKF